MIILSAAAFAIRPTTNSMKVYSAGQMIFVCDTILPIKHTVDWELICERINDSLKNKRYA